MAEGQSLNQGVSIELSSPAFDQAKKGDDGISKAYFPTDQTSPQVDVYSPITNEQGSVIGIIKSQVTLNTLTQIFSRLNLGKDGVAYIVDDEGQIISHPQAAKIANQHVSILGRPVVNKLLKGGYASLQPIDHYYTNESNVPVVSSSNLISSLKWVAVVEQPESKVFGQLLLTRNLLLVGMAIGLLLLVVIALAISNGLAGPIMELKSSAKRIQQGDLSSRLQIHTGDELQDLAGSFNAMANELQEREAHLQQTNSSLKLERDRQETLLQSLTDGVLAVDGSGQILLFNKAAEVITGIIVNQAVGRSIDEVVHFFNDTTLLPLSQYSDQQDEFKLQLHQRGLTFRRGRISVPVSLTVSPIVPQGRSTSGWVVSFRDMTKEHEFEAMKLDFVSMAAHELRTPLTALRGYLSIIQEETEKILPEPVRVFLNRSMISANQLASLVENLLNVSRIERGVLKVDLVPLQIESMITETLTNLMEVARQNQIQLTFDQPEKSLPPAMIDRFRLAEVLTNLVANGITYTKRGGWVKVSLQLKEHQLITSVTDNGEGIPAASIPHLFTKFYRVQASLAQGSKGTGLGLFISKAIVTAHHGTIWVDSKEGKGSTFSFSIPVATDEEIKSMGRSA
jgi:PAS domain S-box-containing protein